MSEISLDSFVASQSHGHQIESSSEFTLDSLRARQKLSESQLPRPGLWLVKLVQAANSMEATSIDISFGKRLVKFEFVCSQWSYSPREVLAQFLTGVLSNDPFLFHFLTGVRGALTDDTSACCWRVEGRGSSFEAKVLPEATEIRVQDLDEVNSGVKLTLSVTRPSSWPGLKRALTLPVRHLLQRTADEFLAVKNHCWPSFAPIKLDGRRLRAHYQWSPSRTSKGAFSKMEQFAVASSHQPPPFVMARHRFGLLGRRDLFEVPWMVSAGSRESICFGQGEAQKQTSGHYWGQPWIESAETSLGLSEAVLLIIVGHEMESRVEFVCEGAVVATQVLPWLTTRSTIFGQPTFQNHFKLGVRVLVACTSEQLDLSHFQLRDSEWLVAEEIEQIGAALREVTILCQKHYSTYQIPFGHVPESGIVRVALRAWERIWNFHPLWKPFLWMTLRRELEALLRSLDDSCAKLQLDAPENAPHPHDDQGSAGHP